MAYRNPAGGNFMKLNLRAQFLLPIVGVVVLSMAASGALSYRNATDALWNGYISTANEIAATASLGFTERVGDLRTTLTSQAKAADITGVLTPGGAAPDPVGTANAALRDIMEANPVLQAVNIIGPDGIVAASTRPDSVGRDNLAERDYFRNGMRGETTITDAFMSKISNAPVFVLAVPIRKDGKVLGVLSAPVDLAVLSARLVDPVKVGKNGYAFLVARSGKLAAHPRKDLLLKLDLNELDWGKKLIARRSGTLEYEFEGQHKAAAFTLNETTGWIIAVNVSASDIAASVTGIRNAAMATGGGAIVLVCLVVFWIVRGVTRALGSSVSFAQAVADGDLGRSLDLRRNDEIGTLADALRTMVGNLREMIATADHKTAEAEEQTRRAEHAVQEAEAAKRRAEEARREGMLQAAGQLDVIVMRVGAASEELAAQIEQSSRGTEVQRERTAEAATAMDQMNASVLEVARNATDAAESADRARATAQEGAGVVESVVDAIDEVSRHAGELTRSLGDLGTRAEGIGRIMGVISDIADQTNLLALNAAIEAARAGDAGRGFAVVADEVRKLAEKTMNATREVDEAVRAIQTGTRENIRGMEEASGAVSRSTELATVAGRSLGDIVTIVQTTADQVRSIATASEEQSAASEQINRGTEEVNRIATETADAMNQSAAAVSELARMAAELRGLVEELKRA